MSAFDDAREEHSPEHGWAVSCYLGRPDPLVTGTPLDAALGNGLMPGVTVIGGQASAGKSALACQIAANVAVAGKRVLYLTLDDTWGGIMSRVISSYSVDHSPEWNGQAFMWSALDAMRNALAPKLEGADEYMLSRLSFDLRNEDAALMAAAHWDDGPGHNLCVTDNVETMADVGRMLDAMDADGSMPHLVVADYVQQFMTGDPDTDRTEYSRVTAVANDFQKLAQRAGIPVLMLSSLTKGVANSGADPSLDWFRGSGYIGYDAYAAAVLTKDEGTGEEGWPNATINVVKNKAGKSGISVPVTVYGGYSLVRSR